MRFSKNEKLEIISYVVEDIVANQHVSVEKANSMIKESPLLRKFDTAPNYIAHCSIGQLVDMVSESGKKKIAI